MVQGQLQVRRGAGELPLPVAELRLQAVTLQPSPLPGGKVGVLNRQLGEGGRLTGPHRPVEQDLLAHQQSDRPEVGHDMVHGELEDVVVRTKPQDLRPQQRQATEVERPARFLREQGAKGPVPLGFGERGEIDEWQRQVVAGSDRLGWPAVGARKEGAQDLMAADGLGEASLEGHQLERTLEAHGHRDVEER